MIDETGCAHGVREMLRLKSVVEASKQHYYKSKFEKSAVYMRGITQDHPFVDGNKKTDVTVAIIFLELNNIKVTFKLSELENFAVRVAVENLDINEIASWLKNHQIK